MFHFSYIELKYSVRNIFTLQHESSAEFIVGKMKRVCASLDQFLKVYRIYES